MWEDSEAVDMALAADILAKFLEETVAAQKGGLVTFSVPKIFKWYANAPASELLTERVKYYIRRYVEKLHKRGALGKVGRSFALSPDSPLWTATKAGLTRVYLANALMIPELPPDLETEAARKRRLRALVEQAKRAGIDDKWISRACSLLASGKGEDAEVRSKVAQIVEEVEGELKARARRWREEGLNYAEVQSLYSRLLHAVELLIERYDREAAERLCEALTRIQAVVEAVMAIALGLDI